MFPWSFLSVKHQEKWMRRHLQQNGLQGIFNRWLRGWFHVQNPEFQRSLHKTRGCYFTGLVQKWPFNTAIHTACWNQCVKVKAAMWSRVAGSTINLPVRLLSQGSQCLRLRLLFSLRRTSEFFNKVSGEDAAQVRQQPWLKYSSWKIGQKQAS